MIEPNNKRYNRNTAAYLGYMAVLSYEPSEYVISHLKSLGSKKTTYYDEGDTQAFLAEFNDYAVLAFKGSKEIGDWITDFDFGKHHEGDFEAHGGFVDALDLIWKFLRVDISDISNKSIFLCGHSLGGGLASIASARLWNLNIPHITYTFGCPRALSEDFAFWYNRHHEHTCHRTVNNNDLVTRLPPREFDFGHIGTFHYYEEDGTQNDTISWWSKLLDEIKGRIADIGKLGPDSVKDHFKTDYLTNLERNTNG